MQAGTSFPSNADPEVMNLYSTMLNSAEHDIPIVSKKVRVQRYNQVPHLTQDTNGKVTNSQLYTTNESQEASPFPAGDHKAQINRRDQGHNKNKTDKNKLKMLKKKDISSLKTPDVVSILLINDKMPTSVQLSMKKVL